MESEHKHGNHRELPGHIAAALAGAGGLTDSAGQPWAGRSLAGEDAKIHNFENDDGTADADYLAAVDRLQGGRGSEAEVVASLATARVFIPIVAQLAEEAEQSNGLHADKQADMAMVTLKAPDGRTAMPVFTSSEALSAWHPTARPVAAYAARAALSAVSEDAQLLVIDPGQAFTFVVRRPALWSLAQQREWTPSYLDAEVEASVREVAGGFPQIRGVGLSAGHGVYTKDASGAVLPGGGAGPELCLELALEDGLDAAAVQSLVAGVQQNLASNEVFAERVDSLELKLRRAQN
ncbi:SseB family protein [Pseudarthrobacter sp. J1738]|uniref:SseB family protein n=1 Tax=unclassified Pseudarthrobacter TaxID=2647000 RepID=UPI003D2D9A26